MDLHKALMDHHSVNTVHDHSVQKKTHVVEDTVEITYSTPYKDFNFLGTYLAVVLGTIASYGGYVMPATSLSLINDDIGMPS